MKKTITIAIACLWGVLLHAQSAKSPASPEQLVLAESTHDFGMIQQGRPVTYAFAVKNRGDKPLHIENVTASCGCTTPEWSKEEMAPGEESKIIVGYNAAADGSFDKTVTIFYGGGQVQTLHIRGQVFKGPATSAPPNASVLLLKQ